MLLGVLLGYHLGLARVKGCMCVCIVHVGFDGHLSELVCSLLLLLLWERWMSELYGTLFSCSRDSLGNL